MEKLSFKVEGEYICNLARNWFWDENRPYQECEELLLSALGCGCKIEEKKKIAQDILEGTKILKGVNEFTLENDSNSHYRPITDRDEKFRFRILISDLEDDIESHPEIFIDKYAKDEIVEDILEEFPDIRKDELLEKYFERNQDIKEELGGLWLLNDPKLILKANHLSLNFNPRSEDFWENIYKATKDDPLLVKRTRVYESEQRLLKRVSEKKITVTENNKDINMMNAEEYQEYLFRVHGNYWKNNIFPDNLEKPLGLVSPDGKYYSCEFGDHNIKAFYLMAKDYDKYGYKTRDDVYFDMNCDSALDVLIDYGWVAIRCMPYRGYFITSKPNCINKKQKDTTWDVATKHSIRFSNEDYAKIF